MKGQIKNYLYKTQKFYAISHKFSAFIYININIELICYTKEKINFEYPLRDGGMWDKNSASLTKEISKTCENNVSSQS